MRNGTELPLMTSSGEKSAFVHVKMPPLQACYIWVDDAMVLVTLTKSVRKRKNAYCKHIPVYGQYYSFNYLAPVEALSSLTLSLNYQVFLH